MILHQLDCVENCSLYKIAEFRNNHFCVLIIFTSLWTIKDTYVIEFSFWVELCLAVCLSCHHFEAFADFILWTYSVIWEQNIYCFRYTMPSVDQEQSTSAVVSKWWQTPRHSLTQKINLGNTQVLQKPKTT